MFLKQGQTSERGPEMTNLNDNERKALGAICADCDELDGWGFTRIADMILAVMREFDNGQVVGGYISDLMKKNLIDVDAKEDEVWVSPKVFEAYC